MQGAIGSAAFWVLNEMAVALNPFSYQPITVAFVVACESTGLRVAGWACRVRGRG